jgi:hypothetical protein
VVGAAAVRGVFCVRDVVAIKNSAGFK